MVGVIQPYHGQLAVVGEVALDHLVVVEPSEATARFGGELGHLSLECLEGMLIIFKCSPISHCALALWLRLVSLVFTTR